jgi:glycosyltransferase involved in cell wall biosynthesis
MSRPWFPSAAARLGGLDVLTLSCWYGANASIQKVLDTIRRFNGDLRQHDFSIGRGGSCYNPRTTSFGTYQDFVVLANKSKPRLVHLHFNSLVPFKRSDLGFEVKVVQTVHGIARTIFLDECDAVVCIHEAGRAAQAGLPGRHKIHVIYNNVPVTSEVDVDKLEAGSPLFVCRTSAEDFDETTARTLAACVIPPKKVTVVGYSKSNAYAGEFLTIAKRHGKSLRLVPWTTDIEKVYRRASFLIETSPRDPTGASFDLSVQEAVGMGLPVVARRREQTRATIVEHGVNGFICDSDEEIIARCRQLQGNPDLLKRFSENSKLRFRKLLSGRPMAQEYRALYDMLWKT